MNAEGSMFERFTDEARRTVVLAQDEARLLQHNYIGTEHLLLGLLAMGKGVAADVLGSVGVTLDDVRGQVAEIVGRGRKEPLEQMPFTPRAKKVLELSLREALQLGHGDINGGHLLLALLREGEGVAVLGLTQLGVEPAVLRTRVLGALPPRSDQPVRPRRQMFRRKSGPAVEAGFSAIPIWPMERLHDHAWDALVEARGTARQRAADVIGTVDLLAGIAAMGGAAAETLRAADVDLEALDAAVLAIPGTEDDPPQVLPFAAGTRAALSKAFDEAHHRGRTAVTPAHVLSGLLADPDEDLMALLDGLAVDLARLRAQAARRIDES
jgi:ATP-dependent Clp protease ATP-binding subunit ClpA